KERIAIEQHFAQSRPGARFERAAILILWAGGWFWIVPVGLSLLWPPFLMGHMFAFALQTAAGKPAGRLRCAARTFFAWLPFAAFFPVVALIGAFGYAPAAADTFRREGFVTATFLLQGYGATLGTVSVALGAAIILGVVYSVIRPARALPDLLA